MLKVAITAVGQADCTAGTIPVTISGNPGTTYFIQEILNGNNNNAAAANTLGGNTVSVPFNADGSGIVSFNIRYDGQAAGEECARSTSNPVVCAPPGGGGGTPNGCNTDADPTTYSLYWPYPENSMFEGYNCGRGLEAQFSCSVAGSCGTQAYGMTVGDGCGAHFGTDFYAQDWSQTTGICNDNFYAPLDGTVIYVYDQCAISCGSAPNCDSDTRPYGNQVTILSTDGNYAFLVGHLNTVNVTLNSTVTAGQLLGTIGNTGNSFGAHVHAAFYQNVNDPFEANGASFVDQLRNGRTRGVVSGNNATAFAQDFEFDCTNSIEVLSAATAGECYDPGAPVAVNFQEAGTLQEVFVEFCPTNGAPCQTAAGGAPFMLDENMNTSSWTLNTTAPAVQGNYTIKIYDQNNTTVQATSAFAFEVATNCTPISADCIPPASISPTSNATGTQVVSELAGCKWRYGLPRRVQSD